jgi:hypothetical protein
MGNMANSKYKPVPHDAAFKKALLAKPDVKKAYDALEEEYSKLHATHDAQWAQEAESRLAAYRRGEVHDIPLNEVIAKYTTKSA